MCVLLFCGFLSYDMCVCACTMCAHAPGRGPGGGGRCVCARGSACVHVRVRACVGVLVWVCVRVWMCAHASVFRWASCLLISFKYLWSSDSFVGPH